MIEGVLFDMDGVLVNSEPFICKAAIMMFSVIGLKVSPDDFRPFEGLRSIFVICCPLNI